MVVEIKFCGLTRREDAAAAATLGASYAGVVMAGGPRKQTVDSAARVFDGVDGVQRAGVFAAGDPSLGAATATLRLDVIQLHGDVNARDVERARASGPRSAAVWAVARVGPDGLAKDIAELFQVADAVVLDTATASGLGGSGTRFDWDRAAEQLSGMPRRARLVLAGGLRPENVVGAIRALRPDVVDVSSGVESAPGIKDIALMRRFVDAVRSV